MNHLQLIIKREYLTKVRNKSFIIMTFLSPVIMIGLFSLVGYLSQVNNDKVRIINVLDESSLFASQFEDTDNLKYNRLESLSLDQAKAKTEKSGDYGLLYIPKNENIDELAKSITFYSEDSPSLGTIGDIESAIRDKANTIKLNASNYDAEKIKELRVKVDTKLETFKGEETSKLGSGIKLVFGGAAGYLLFMFIIIYGNMIMRSVIEEKTSRIIEVIISSVKPIKLLLGKIIGTSLAGVTQFAAWVILLGVLSAIVPVVFGIDLTAIQEQQMEAMAQTQDSGLQSIVTDAILEIQKLPIANLVIMFLLFFVGGYLLYASLYAAIGAAVDSETDTQQFMLPLLMPLILAVYVGFFTVIDNPHGTVSQVFSYIPFTSPVVMLMRIPFGVPLWQQILSVVILFATFIGTVWFAAKIYRVGILMYGKKASYKELAKWLKY
ncbi:ABC transporter permease [Marinirhabdus gelatinilytica]|uniref:ABC-2 type transport system permease protein n=1 Tax=Marinirhabdus gelatinilytica TaxID=1703343 RepID=A0A370Q8U7_9FLAO|nr:ABC transporter permease [Marinirhabdus gelatinilytica]RDK84763.1 ABC-2 type transport system permease protein [Marinirhabdus gelatinilytica]